MTDLRKQARNRPCMIRLQGCDGGGETTVLAHYRLAGYSGMGLKPDDALGAWACNYCHSAVDGRSNPLMMEREDYRKAHAEGVMRTFAALRKEGVL